ncbi:sodium:solute symporter family protein [Methanosalsum natronophilum]|uniref:sodium:solute symporter family protein n=1 Tax=Methanosalsum natronophilum TaxID=768733 RepID=UPI002168286A|nr:sodium:solute symporter family protein [Methanosalsum natronophilum]MCS3923456.1 SSS family solute:Na+ symporter [Methanosalsum natronophilum]
MESYEIFLALLAGYILILVAIGFHFTKKQRSITDFWLAGREVRAIGIGFSAAASWLTAGAILAVIGYYMIQGMGSIWGFVAPNVLALLIIALFVSKIKSLPSITQPELLEQRYGSKIRAPIAVIITIVMILFAVADIKGFALVLEVLFGLSPVYAAVIVAVAVSTYVTLGGLNAVVWTDALQFMFLSTFVILMAVIVTGSANGSESLIDISSINIAQTVGSVPSEWWNPFSIGIPMVLIFVLAIIPGWITEQDPWQKVWAAKDVRSARIGLIAGSFLVLIVFGACAFIALGLNSIYPEIAEMGYPAGMAYAEPALLEFMSTMFSPLLIAIAAIGLAAAAMSCADTFATSGASCVSRDIYQRFVKPDATMKEMMVINRVSVIFIVITATIASFFIDSIIHAVHIATFIASASYFFPIMGGIFWKRATTQGALAGVFVGATLQIGMTIFDTIKDPVMGVPYLESIHPALMGHGVILSMALSGTAFILVSLTTKAPDNINLAPFFKEAAEELYVEEIKTIDENDVEYVDFLKQIRERKVGERAHIHLEVSTSAMINWSKFSEELKNKYPVWVAPSGGDSLYRLTNSDMLACVKITRGNTQTEIWFASEPPADMMESQRRELYIAFKEIQDILHDIGVIVDLEKNELQS